MAEKGSLVDRWRKRHGRESFRGAGREKVGHTRATVLKVLKPAENLIKTARRFQYLRRVQVAHMAYLRVHSLAVASYLALSLL